MNTRPAQRSLSFIMRKASLRPRPILLLLALMGFGGWFPVLLQADSYLLDRSTLGYRIQYLEGWTIEVGEPRDGIDSYFSHEAPEVEVNIAVVQAPPDVNAVEADLLAMVAEETRNIYKDVMGFTSRVEPWKDKSAAHYSFSGLITGEEANNIRTFNKQYIVLHDGRFYVITIVAAEDDLEKARPVWKEFLDHLQFVES